MRRVAADNALRTQAIIAHPLGPLGNDIACGVWSAECKVWSVECGVWSENSESHRYPPIVGTLLYVSPYAPQGVLAAYKAIRFVADLGWI